MADVPTKKKSLKLVKTVEQTKPIETVVPTELIEFKEEE